MAGYKLFRESRGFKIVKRIGVDCYIEDFEERKRTSEESSCPFDKMGIQADVVLRDQNELQMDLQKLAERLEHDGCHIIRSGPNRFRVVAPDEEVDALCKRIENLYRDTSPSSEKTRLFENELHWIPVPEDTPIEECARWDENRWARIEDFSQFRPAKDELIALVKHWVKEYYSWRWFVEMEGGSFGSRDVIRNMNRPHARIARIEHLLGSKLVEEAVEEAKREFERDLHDPLAWEIFEHGSDREQGVFYDIWNSAWERKSKEREETISKFVQEQSLDENQETLLRRLARSDPKAHLTEILRMMPKPDTSEF